MFVLFVGKTITVIVKRIIIFVSLTKFFYEVSNDIIFLIQLLIFNIKFTHTQQDDIL